MPVVHTGQMLLDCLNKQYRANLANGIVFQGRSYWVHWNAGFPVDMDAWYNGGCTLRNGRELGTSRLICTGGSLLELLNNFMALQSDPTD